jgi:hypothetical protein
MDEGNITNTDTDDELWAAIDGRDVSAVVTLLMLRPELVHYRDKLVRPSTRPIDVCRY